MYFAHDYEFVKTKFEDVAIVQFFRSKSDSL